jgi:transcriptional regulator with PAS, ATPase and Fis domain
VYTTRSQGSLFDTTTADGTTAWWLGIVHHADWSVVGRRVPLPNNTRVELGREATCFGRDALADGRISRRHAVVSVDEEGSVRIKDLRSRNGTFVNGARVLKSELEQGDVIGLGSVLLLAYRAPAFFETPAHETIVGVSWPVARIIEDIQKVAPHPTSVLVLGETGTGKELVAREIHRNSGRRGELHVVNCGGVADTLLQSELFGHVRGAFSGAERDRTGILEAANGGTVFLDEIGDASPTLQVSLLRFLQEGEVRKIGSNRPLTVDTRVVAATHRDLGAMVAEGTFREDLHARLAGWILELAPLRDRREDIPHLVDHFVRGQGRSCRVHHRLARRLLAYDWPANIRELKAVIERAVIENDGADQLRITPHLDELLKARAVQAEQRGRFDPPSDVGPAAPARAATIGARVGRPSADELKQMIRAHNGNIRLLSQDLGVARNTIYRWMKASDIDIEALRRDPVD